MESEFKTGFLELIRNKSCDQHNISVNVVKDIFDEIKQPLIIYSIYVLRKDFFPKEL